MGNSSTSPSGWTTPSANSTSPSTWTNLDKAWKGLSTDSSLGPSPNVNYTTDSAALEGAAAMGIEANDAETAATACSKALTEVAELYAAIMVSPNPLTVDSSWFGTRSDLSYVLCGSQLANQINTTVTDLGQLLQAHGTILQEMETTFINAGKKYAETEYVNANQFKNKIYTLGDAPAQDLSAAQQYANTKFASLDGSAGSGSAGSSGDGGTAGSSSASSAADGSTNASSTQITAWPQNATDMADVASSDTLASVSPPKQYTSIPDWTPKYSFADTITCDVWSNYSWSDCYHLHQSINPSKVADVSAMWQVYANGLVETYENMFNSIDAMAKQGTWFGAGWNSAATLLTEYLKQAQNLTGQMYAISGQIKTAASWLKYVQSRLPTTPTPDKTVAEMKANGVDANGNPIYIVSGYKQVPAVTTATATTPASGKPYWPVLSQSYWSGASETANGLPTLQTPSISLLTGDGSGSGSGSGDGSGSSDGSGSGNDSGSIDTSTGAGAARDADAVAAEQNAEAALAGQNPADTYPADTTTAAATDTSGSTTTSATDPTSSAADTMSGLADAAQQGLGSMQSAAMAGQQNPSAAEQAAADREKTAAADAEKAIAGTSLPGIGGSKIGGVGGAGGESEESAVDSGRLLGTEEAASKLFPRTTTDETAAATAAEEEAAAGRAGAASNAGTPGSPGAIGGNQQQREKQRNSRLDSARHLDEAIDDNLVAVRPVLGEQQ